VWNSYFCCRCFFFVVFRLVVFQESWGYLQEFPPDSDGDAVGSIQPFFLDSLGILSEKEKRKEVEVEVEVEVEGMN